MRSEANGDIQCRVRSIPCQVIGVLQSKGLSLTGSDQDDVVVVPYNAPWIASGYPEATLRLSRGYNRGGANLH